VCTRCFARHRSETCQSNLRVVPRAETVAHRSVAQSTLGDIPTKRPRIGRRCSSPSGTRVETAGRPDLRPEPFRYNVQPLRCQPSLPRGVASGDSCPPTRHRRVGDVFAARPSETCRAIFRVVPRRTRSARSVAHRRLGEHPGNVPELAVVSSPAIRERRRQTVGSYDRNPFRYNVQPLAASR